MYVYKYITSESEKWNRKIKTSKKYIKYSQEI